MAVLNFKSSPTLRDMVLSEKPVVITQGPIESGKSVGCMARLYKQMITMPRCIDGIRRSRTLIARNTYPQLKESTAPTVRSWFPEKLYGPFSGSEPFSLHLKFLDVEAEWVFMALPEYNERVVANLRSTEWTNAWFNEMQFASRELIVEVISRTGRYPKKDLCPAYDRKRRFTGDLNAPHVHDHWILYMRGDTPLPPDMDDDDKIALRKPENWEFFVQPPAVREVVTPTGKLIRYEQHPRAENVSNMGEGGYLALTEGKTRSEIRRDLGNKVVPIQKGKPRYPKFDRDWHVAKQPIEPVKDAPIYIGGDFGLACAFVFEQKIGQRWFTLDELVGDNESAEEMAPQVLDLLSRRFPFWRQTGLHAWGDPQGSWGNASTKTQTPFRIFQKYGIIFYKPAEKDNPRLRLETGRRMLNDVVDRQPKCLIDPRCTRLIASLDGGATQKEVRVNGGLQIREEINKDEFSHICEAWEYPKWGGGEARESLRPAGANGSKPINTLGKKSVYLSKRRRA